MREQKPPLRERCPSGELRNLGLCPTFLVNLLDRFSQAAFLLCDSVASSVKWGMENSPDISSEISLCSVKYHEVHIEGGREGFFLLSALFYHIIILFISASTSTVFDSLPLPTGKTFKNNLLIS